jgi:CHAT domain-containing protein
MLQFTPTMKSLEKAVTRWWKGVLEDMIHSSDVIPPTCRRLQRLAERDPRRALRLIQRAGTISQVGSPLERAWADYSLGWALLCGERFDAARPHLQEAQATFTENGARLAALHCTHALLRADLMQFTRPDLEAEFAELAEQFSQIGARVEMLSVLLDQARYLNASGRSQAAEVVLDQAAPLIMQADLLMRARMLRARAMVASRRGESYQASQLLDQAAQIFASLNYRPELAQCWLDQAWVALKQERLDVAHAGYQRAQQMFVKLDLPLYLAFATRALGLTRTKLGLYDQALRATLSALDQFQRLGCHSDIGACQSHLGNIYYYTGRWDAALAYYLRAEGIAETSGAISDSLTARRNRAMVYQAQGQGAQARELLDVLENQAQELGDQAELAEVRHQQAVLMAEGGSIDEAMIRYAQTSALFTATANLPAVADCAREQGWLLLQAGKVDQASTLFQSAIAGLSRHPHKRWRVDYGLARCAQARGDVAVALAHYREAIVTVAELRQRLVSEEISSSIYMQAARLHTDALRLAAESGDTEAVLAFGEWQRALVLRRLIATHAAALPAEFQAEHDQLYERLRALLASGSSVRLEELDATLKAYGDLLLRARHSTLSDAEAQYESAVMAFDLAGIRRQLSDSYGQDWTALVYLVEEDILRIVTITPDELALDHTPYNADLRDLVKRTSEREYRFFTYRNIAYHIGQATQPWVEPSALAIRLLPAAVRARLHPQHRLLISPAGVLHALPWAVLRFDDCWLVERAVVRIIPSLTTWQSLAERPASPEDTALLVGCSDFDGRERTLLGIARELDTVALHWPGACQQLRDEQATRAALLDRSSSGELMTYRLLHIASHAQFLPARGLMAHLKLSDGDLLLPEIVSLRLSGALVILSTCDGAAADALAGEEVFSLSWAFLAAGASGVVASLWPVEDYSVPRIMGVFYDMLRQYDDPALALAEAQRKLVEDSTTDTDSALEPQGWGSFVAIGGDWRRR